MLALTNNKPKKSNIKISELNLIKTIQIHKQSVNKLIIIEDKRLATCSLDKKIRIFNLKTYECEIVINSHKDCVLDITLTEKGYILSSSNDCTMKLFEIKNNHYQCLKTLRGHENSISKAIQLSNNRFCSCSSDQTIRIWESNQPYECIKKITENTISVYSIIESKNKKYIIYTNDDKVLRFLDNKEYYLVKEIKNIDCSINNSLVEIFENILIVTGKRIINIINISVLQVQSTIIFPKYVNYIDSIIYFYENYICSANKMLIQFEPIQLKTIDFKKKVHKDCVYNLISYENKIFTCSYDRKVNIWGWNNN